MKRFNFKKVNGEVPSEGVQRWLGIALRTLTNGDYTITISRQRKHRSIQQNRLMWLWFACVESETGTPAQDVHDFFCLLFLRRSATILGESEEIVGGTSTLNSKEMSDFMDKVQAYAASEWGMILPLPSDLGYDEFYETYKGRI
jgi:hypothetical protein